MGKKGPNEFRPSLFTNKNPNQGARVMDGDDKKGNKGEVPVRQFTPAKLQKRREQGLCFHCDERYSFSYVCKKLFLIEIKEEEPLKPDIVVPEEEELGDRPEIFLNTIMDMTTP